MTVQAKTAVAARTAADVLADALAQLGVSRIFGVPGGGSSLDLIEAAARAGIPFTLARHEGSAAMMATASAEVTGRPGAVLVTKGPGLANAANGIANASLERAPVLLVTDGFTPTQAGYVTHQVFDQAAFMAPLVRGYAVTSGPDLGARLAELVAAMHGPCRGPAVLEMTGEAARRLADTVTLVTPIGGTAPDPEALASAAALLRDAQRPVIVAGLEARDDAASVRALARALGAPVLVTYKAKGVVSDDDPLFGGIFTGGAAEAGVVDQADLILLAGLDPVELILQPWRYRVPVVDVARFRRPVHYAEPAVVIEGAIGAALDALAARASATRWSAGAIAEARKAWLGTLANPGAGDRIGPERVVTLAAEACARAELHPRVAVDAGAHMFSATSFWPCREPNDLLISNGLASMGFALPAAIAAALAEPERRALAFTGDGGLLMCLGELATAASAGARIVVIVFNDGSLSLIDLKKGRRALPHGSVGWAHPGFAEVARGLGCAGFTVATVAAYRAALDAALAVPGPAVIDVRIDAAGYPEQLRAARG
ncbi:thiamine pyrophosphate-dependent enzyme [Elioraea sp.]|uniref:thiamine pyrophosphate-dependent enzyme n=1 Tax=Elioraea sp. TaxID=2185103 RepID=UPI003F70D2C9